MGVFLQFSVLFCAFLKIDLNRLTTSNSDLANKYLTNFKSCQIFELRVKDSSGNPGMKRRFYQRRGMRSWNG